MMKNTMPAPPLHHVFDLGDLSQGGSVVTVAAGGDELARLAQWANVDAVRAFSGAVTLKRLSQTHFAFEADLDADIVQSCVVTLEPVETHISRHIARELHLVRSSRRTPAAVRRPGGAVARSATGVSPENSSGELTLSVGDDDVPETITSPDYDLAAPLLEEFALAIEPYPRKAGAAFTPPAAPEEAPENPFAALKRQQKQD